MPDQKPSGKTALTSPIIWQNDDQTIVLIDIPHSISVAQGTVAAPNHHNIISCKPIDHPYDHEEPKSEKGWAGVFPDVANNPVYLIYINLIQDARRVIRENYDGKYFLDRSVHEEDVEMSDWPGEQDDNRKKLKAPLRLKSTLPVSLLFDRTEAGGLRECISTPSMSCEDCEDMGPDLHSNCTDQLALLSTIPATTKHPDEISHHFRIPPRSSFFLGDLTRPRDFHSFIRKQTDVHDFRSRKFDCMVMDPPWANASAKRAAKTSPAGYSVNYSVPTATKLLLRTDLDTLMEDNCLVGIWITNGPGVRDAVLGPDGLFVHWNIAFIEEWIWVKTTVDGETVLPVDATMRKSYEVFVLGRKRPLGVYSRQTINLQEVKRRVLVGVPDFHSRKPCLKKIIEPMLEDISEPRVLEVFARYLVAGWWSWGNECLKYNWEGNWKL